MTPTKIRSTKLASLRWPRRTALAAMALLALFATHPSMTMAQSASRGWTVGDAFAPPPLELLDGSRVDWTALKGKVVVIEFWGSWCPFCARQNPVLNKFYLEHQSRGLEVITISLDKTKDAAVGYMKKGGYAFKAGMATPAWNDIYKQRKGLPQLLVVDRNGRIVMIEVREMMEEDIRDIARYL